MAGPLQGKLWFAEKMAHFGLLQFILGDCSSQMRAKIPDMSRTNCFSAVLGLAAAISLGLTQAAGQQSASRPDYPIVLEIHVDQSCGLLPDAAHPVAAGKKPRLKRDSTICHLESIHHSEHVEKTVVQNEVRRGRVAVAEQEYVLQDITAGPVVFVVEQSVRKGWIVDSDPQPSETQGSTALFRVHAEPGQIVRLHVGMRHTRPLKTKVLPVSVYSGSSNN
jgi:hypothetical protein